MNFDQNTYVLEAHDNIKSGIFKKIQRTLESDGYVKIKCGQNFNESDNANIYLIDLITKLGGKCLKHNDNDDSYVWQVKPMIHSTDGAIARSHTNREFEFHTDCSYETDPPEYMALFVLQPDRYGGGILQVIRADEILSQMSDESKEVLREKFTINVPLEFRKLSDIDHINEPILFKPGHLRYRNDIVDEKLLDEKKRVAIKELNSVVFGEKVTVHTPVLDKYSLIIIDNGKFLHGRTKILDVDRLLLRVRFNSLITYNRLELVKSIQNENNYDVFSMFDKNKLHPGYIHLTNDLLAFMSDRQQILFDAINQIVTQYTYNTSVGDEIRTTIALNPKAHDIICKLNQVSPFNIGCYRPDILFAKYESTADECIFTLNGNQGQFAPKICEINGRFSLNAYLLTAAVCTSSGDQDNQISENFRLMLETITNTFDTSKPMVLLKDREKGYDINIFKQFWCNTFRTSCRITSPLNLKIVEQKDGKQILSDDIGIIEQFILELHQDEILDLPDNILNFFIYNKQLRYINDLRTIFLVHDKRLLSLLSNLQFLRALFIEQSTVSDENLSKLAQIIPITHVLVKMPDYFKHLVLEKKNQFCIKPNSLGKGQNVMIGAYI
ncbi:unnamed protein product [Didymodactylos carnosus]|uniref:TauD/TfdA-like domain-containing protein n=1 Tax=Didymodactylos carnosus TaxID=1234261 RepID=A0A8S2EAI2_9BILA|nr:unnamed protein product [Didymodactylos carnosus]CAF3986034.1 unnamed protein product [Didymodactylos carnosus]